MKRIVSVCLPHWPIERLRRDSPRSAPACDDACDTSRNAQDTSHPFALVETGHRGVRLSALNAAAQAAGIRAGDSLADARALLPSLATAPAMPAADREGLRRLALWLGRYGIARNAYGLGVESESGHTIRCYGLWVDCTGVDHLYGGEAALLADLARRLGDFGLTARLGLADTMGAAHAMAWYEQARIAIAPRGQARAAIAHLPVAALRLERGRINLLHRLGFKQIGSLVDVPRQALERRFRSRAEGERVLLRLDQALGTRDEPRRPLLDPPLFCVRQPFADPLMTPDALHNEVQALISALCAKLDAASMGLRAARLVLYRSDGSCAQVRLVTSSPARTPAHLMGLLVEKLATLDLGFGVDLLVFDAVRLEPLRDHQESLMRGGARHGATCGLLIDHLASRLGASRVTRIVPQVSHWPEYSETRREALTWTLKTATLKTAPVARHVTPRPHVLFTPPEQITVTVHVPQGAPARFTWRRVTHRIVRAEGPERIEPEWWRALKPCPSSGPPRYRDYYSLEDEAGGQFWVFRAERTDSGDNLDEDPPARAEAPAWFVHGLFG